MSNRVRNHEILGQLCCGPMEVIFFLGITHLRTRIRQLFGFGNIKKLFLQRVTTKTVNKIRYIPLFYSVIWLLVCFLEFLTKYNKIWWLSLGINTCQLFQQFHSPSTVRHFQIIDSMVIVTRRLLVGYSWLLVAVLLFTADTPPSPVPLLSMLKKISTQIKLYHVANDVKFN